jgi:hypothetical protein
VELPPVVVDMGDIPLLEGGSNALFEFVSKYDGSQKVEWMCDD